MESSYFELSNKTVYLRLFRSEMKLEITRIIKNSDYQRMLKRFCDIYHV